MDNTELKENNLVTNEVIEEKEEKVLEDKTPVEIIEEKIQKLYALKRLVKKGELHFKGDNRQEKFDEIESLLFANNINYQVHNFKSEIIITIL